MTSSSLPFIFKIGMSAARPINRQMRQFIRSFTHIRSHQLGHISFPASPHDSSNMALGLIFDFDGTVTEDDSIASVVNAALSHHKAVSSPETCQSLTDAWHHVVKSYMADLDAYNRIVDPAIQRDRTTPLDVARSHFSNDQRRQIERASLLRVQDAGLFRGVPLEHLFRHGQHHRENKVVKLRNGFSDLIDLIRSPSVRTSSLHGCLAQSYAPVSCLLIPEFRSLRK